MEYPLQAPGVTVYCGSSAGNSPVYKECAASVGAEIARSGHHLIYGGGRMGLMHAVADACRRAGGHTVALIPGFMVERGWNDPDTTYTVVTADMHERKRNMAAHACGVIALPGGIGTFEELTEIITWRQLGLYAGNIVIMNLGGYYDPLLAQLDAAVSAGFMPADHRRLWDVTSSPEEAVRLATRPSDQPLSLRPKF